MRIFVEEYGLDISAEKVADEKMAEASEGSFEAPDVAKL